MRFKVLAAASVLLIGAENAKSGGVSRSLDGISVGAQFGYITQSSKINHRYNFEPFHHKRTDLGGTGVIGGLNLAYGHICPNRLFFGAEIKGELSNLKGKMSEGPFDLFQSRTHLKMTNSFGAALKMGAVISSVLPYVKVGVVSSRWNSSTRISVISDTTNIGGGKKHKRLLGLELGIGVDIPLPEPFGLCDRLTLGGEYTHVEYQKLSYKNVIHAPDETDANCNCETFLKVKAKPRTNAFMLRLKYRLN